MDLGDRKYSEIQITNNRQIFSKGKSRQSLLCTTIIQEIKIIST
jgi:hypothetical protein